LSAVSAGAAALERHLHLPRTWGVLLVIVLVIGLIAAGSYFFGMQIATQMSDLVQAVTEALVKLRDYLGRSALGKAVLGNAQAAKDPAALANCQCAENSLRPASISARVGWEPLIVSRTSAAGAGASVRSPRPSPSSRTAP